MPPSTYSKLTSFFCRLVCQQVDFFFCRLVCYWIYPTQTIWVGVCTPKSTKEVSGLPPLPDLIQILNVFKQVAGTGKVISLRLISLSMGLPSPYFLGHSDPSYLSVKLTGSACNLNNSISQRSVFLFLSSLSHEPKPVPTKQLDSER